MKSIKEQLLQLVDLQKIDLKIYSTKKEMEKMPNELKKLKEEFEPRLQSYEEKQKELKSKEVSHLEMESEIKGKEAHLKQLQGKLSQVKNAKELNAIDAEINATKKSISEMEDEGLKTIDQIDNLKKELKEEEQIIEAEKKNIAELETKIAEKENINKKELETLTKERDKLASKIDPQILSDYEYIARNKEGVGIVGVKNGVCTGCYMSLPPQTVHDIRKGMEIFHCQFCSRVLFYPEWEN
ncbi:MAG: hypothetical protein JW827_07355 [Spirochaetes bacterium]|nr:hypothetical protein [Spirochaetota bacterium]